MNHQNPIRISDLCKVYKLYWGPRALFRELFLRRPSHHQITALKNISLEIARGETFGLVGDNGAGKSTLLKILTGTTFPTSGRVEVHGQVSALLELGTGFHPEFTGRENIYFSGALAGLSRDDIHRQEEAIVEFSGLGDFIDKPVKTYSSGMYVRLGFAVATGFEPEIIIIDEALAVGDQIFQKKCTDRILDFKQRSCTILFCSHALYQVKRLCDRAVWLHRGEVRALASASEVVERYESFCREGENGGTSSADQKHPDLSRKECWIERVNLQGRKTEAPARFETGDTIKLDLRAHFSADFRGKPGVAVALVRNDGLNVYTAVSAVDQVQLKPSGEGLHKVTLVFPEIPLLSGSYYFNVMVTDQNHIQAYDVWEKIEPFVITHGESDLGLTRLRHYWEGRDRSD